MRLEVEEVGEPLGMNDRAIPDGPMYRVCAGRRRLHPPAAQGPRPRDIPAAHDGVVATPANARRRRLRLTCWTPSPCSRGTAATGSYAFRGPEQIIARFKAKGIEFRSVGDGSDVMVTAAGGRAHHEVPRRRRARCRRCSCPTSSTVPSIARSRGIVNP